jgi:hypothetical protein
MKLGFSLKYDIKHDRWAKSPLLNPLNKYPSLLEPEKVPTAGLKIVINYSNNKLNYSSCN